MAEAGEGERKRCICGFWGSPQTNGMCSKCYKEKSSKVENKQPSSSTGNSSNSTESSLLKQLGLVVSSMNDSNSSNKEEDKSDTQSEGVKREELDSAVDPCLPEDRPVQKNRKKCWICKSKLELAQRELGSCKCGYVFCFTHRLPEQHSCIYDHKEGGRQQALKDMVPAGKKKIGRSFHRMDSRPE